jgi:hypothetical protein
MHFSLPDIQFSFTQSLFEGAEGMATVNVCVQLLGSVPSADVTVTLSPSSGSATAGELHEVVCSIYSPIRGIIIHSLTLSPSKLEKLLRTTLYQCNE